MAKSKAQLNEILTTHTSIHRTLRRPAAVVAAVPAQPLPAITRRVATQTTVTLGAGGDSDYPVQWTTSTPSAIKRLRAGDAECDDDSNNNRVSSTEKLKLESQIDSERTAVAALTELSNLKHNSSGSSSAEEETTTGHHAVTSIVNNLNSLNSSDSISVIPITQQAALLERLKDMSQLETAAVLMDISKKVIISPPNSIPHSPPHNQHHHHHSSSKETSFVNHRSAYAHSAPAAADRVKRTNSNSDNMMMDLSIKRVKVEPQEEQQQQQQAQFVQRRESVIKTERGGQRSGQMSATTDQTMENSEALLNTLKNRHQLNVIKLNDHQNSHSSSHQRQSGISGLTVLNVDRLNNGVGMHYGSDDVEDEEDLDDDSSDPGRLQVDMSLENHRIDEDEQEQEEAHHYRNGGKAGVAASGHGYQQQQQQQMAHEGKTPRRGTNKAKGGRKNNNAMDDGRVSSPMMIMGKGNQSTGITAAQLAATAMASMASAAGGPQDAHGLWHLIAQTTLNNNNGMPMGHQSKEAVQLLQQMIQSKNMQLNLGMPPMNLAAALGDMQQPLSLMKVSGEEDEVHFVGLMQGRSIWNVL